MNLSRLFPAITFSRVLRSGALALCFLLWPVAAAAQPSDEQIKKDLIKPGKTVSVTLARPGERRWNSVRSKYEWTRGFTAKVKTDMPDVYVIVKGIAVYDIIGARFVFTKQTVISNQYEGIPNPTQAEVFALIKQLGWPVLMSGIYQSVAGEVESIKLADEPGWEWHTPNSVSLSLELVYHYVVSYTDVEKQKVIYRVRLYRDAIKDPWKNLLTTERKETTLDRKTYTQKQIQQMPNPTRYPFD